MNNQNHHLGVNRIGKNIRKSPIHQPNFPAHPNRQQQQQPQQQQQQPQPQPQVYNINKNDFRSVVQQLTGTPSRDPSPNPPPPPLPAPVPVSRPANNRLQKIRPPPLTPIARPPIVNQRSIPNPSQGAYPNSNSNPNPSFFPRPPPPAHVPSSFPPTPPSLWTSVTESPVSAYMRYLESSVLNPELSRQAQMPPPRTLQGQAQVGLPRPPYPGPPGPGGFNSTIGIGPPLPPPGLLPSPIMPSPSAFLNLLSPRSPYPLLSPRFQFSPPLTPNFLLSPMSQYGGLLGPAPQLPTSPGMAFPPSPSWFASPRWRDM